MFKFSTPRSGQLPQTPCRSYSSSVVLPHHSLPNVSATQSIRASGPEVTDRSVGRIKSRSMATGLATSQMLPINRRLPVRLARQYPSPQRIMTRDQKLWRQGNPIWRPRFRFPFCCGHLDAPSSLSFASSSVGHSLLFIGGLFAKPGNRHLLAWLFRLHTCR